MSSQPPPGAGLPETAWVPEGPVPLDDRTGRSGRARAGRLEVGAITTAGFGDEFADILGELTRLLQPAEDLQAVLSRTGELAKRVLPDCEDVGLRLHDEGRPKTGAFTGGVAEILEGVQDREGEGPAIEASRTGRTCLFRSSEDDRWPRFREAAEKAGIGAAAAFPLVIAGRPAGAMTAYARPPDAFDEPVREAGELLAQHAGAALCNAWLYDDCLGLVDQLNQALASRGVIERAKGILMERKGCSAEDAFDLLRRVSQNQNRKLRDVAREVLDGGEVPGELR